MLHSHAHRKALCWPCFRQQFLAQQLAQQPSTCMEEYTSTCSPARVHCLAEWICYTWQLKA